MKQALSVLHFAGRSDKIFLNMSIPNGNKNDRFLMADNNPGETIIGIASIKRLWRYFHEEANSNDTYCYLYYHDFSARFRER